MPKLPLVLIVIGVVISVLALFFGFHLFPSKLREKISEQGKLVNGTQKWESWRVIPIPVYQKVYIFNVTNPKDVKKGGKPILDELGPFVYQQKRTKVDVSINEENDTIFYRHHDDYIFRPDMSNGKLTDRITVLNLPYLGAVAKAQKMGSISRYFVSEMLNSDFPEEDLYVDITVDEFLFGGYYVPFMQELSDLKGETLLPNNTFGLYYNKNGSESHLYEIYSGVKDPSKFGQVLSYDNKSALEFWNDPYCNQLNGSDGTMLPPYLTPETSFYLFTPTLCRSIKFKYESDTTVLGIPGYKFTVPREFFGDPRVYPENRCFCEEPTEDYENCPRDGVVQLSACRQGTPLVMSFPHFYMGSDLYLNQSEGLNPQKDKHEMTVSLEPTSAISLKVQIRVQMNMELKPSKYFTQLKNIPEMIHPIFWMDQGAGLTSEKAQLIKDKLIRTQELAKLGTYFAFGFGLIFILTAVMIYICRATSVKQKNKYNPKKASLSKMNSFETSETYIEPQVKSDWSKLTPNEKYTIIANSPLTVQRASVEEEPFLKSRAYETTLSSGINHHEPSSRTSTPPVVIAVYPKLSPSSNQPRNSPFQQRYLDEIDAEERNNQSQGYGLYPSAPVETEMPGSRGPNALGVPFPQKNEFASTNSVNNALEEMDNTLKDIQDTLSSYENL